MSLGSFAWDAVETVGTFDEYVNFLRRYAGTVFVVRRDGLNNEGFDRSIRVPGGTSLRLIGALKNSLGSFHAVFEILRAGYVGRSVTIEHLLDSSLEYSVRMFGEVGIDNPASTPFALNLYENYFADVIPAPVPASKPKGNKMGKTKSVLNLRVNRRSGYTDFYIQSEELERHYKSKAMQVHQSAGRAIAVPTRVADGHTVCKAVRGEDGSVKWPDEGFTNLPEVYSTYPTTRESFPPNDDPTRWILNENLNWGYFRLVGLTEGIVVRVIQPMSKSQLRQYIDIARVKVTEQFREVIGDLEFVLQLNKNDVDEAAAE